MCVYSKFHCFLTWSRSWANSYLAVEFIAITIILFQNFGNNNYISGGCGAPWTSLFMVMLMNVVTFANTQDIPVICSLHEKHIAFDKSYSNLKNNDLNNCCYRYFCDFPSFCHLVSSTLLVYSLNMAFRLWTMCLFILFKMNLDQYDHCYSSNLYNMLIATSSILIICTVAFLVCGIVEFFRWCVPITTSHCEKLKNDRLEREKERGLDRIRELELQTRK
jgi:hypothetical protein